MKNSPKQLDWNATGVVSPSVDQGHCGSCWAFVTAGTMESLFAINNPLLPLPSYSVQYLLECDTTNFGCGGGWMADSYLWTIDHGIVHTSDYPHVYSAKKPVNCAAINKNAPRFYNKHSNEEDFTSNEFLKAILA